MIHLTRFESTRTLADGRVLTTHSAPDCSFDFSTGTLRVTVFSWADAAASYGGEQPLCSVDLDFHIGTWSQETHGSIPAFVESHPHWGSEVDPIPGFVWDVVNQQRFDPRTFGDLRAATWVRIKTERDAVEFAPFIYNGMTFDGDATAQRRLGPIISISKSAVAAGQAFSQAWKLADNSMVTLTAQDFVGVEIAKVQQFSAAFVYAETLRVQIDAAVTKEELEAIQWML